MQGPERGEEAAFQLQVRAHLRRNYLAHLGHGLLGQTQSRQQAANELYRQSPDESCIHWWDPPDFFFHDG